MPQETGWAEREGGMVSAGIYETGKGMIKQEKGKPNLVKAR